MLEINASPDRRDLNDVHARAAAAAGVPILINSDAHRVGGFEVARYGIATGAPRVADRGDVANTRPWADVAALRPRNRSSSDARAGDAYARNAEPRAWTARRSGAAAAAAWGGAGGSRRGERGNHEGIVHSRWIATNHSSPTMQSTSATKKFSRSPRMWLEESTRSVSSKIRKPE